MYQNDRKKGSKKNQRSLSDLKSLNEIKIRSFDLLHIQRKDQKIDQDIRDMSESAKLAQIALDIQERKYRPSERAIFDYMHNELTAAWVLLDEARKKDDPLNLAKAQGRYDAMMWIDAEGAIVMEIDPETDKRGEVDRHD